MLSHVSPRPQKTCTSHGHSNIATKLLPVENISSAITSGLVFQTSVAALMLPLPDSCRDQPTSTLREITHFSENRNLNSGRVTAAPAACQQSGVRSVSFQHQHIWCNRKGSVSELLLQVAQERAWHNFGCALTVCGSSPESQWLPQPDLAYLSLSLSPILNLWGSHSSGKFDLWPQTW